MWIQVAEDRDIWNNWQLFHINQYEILKQIRQHEYLHDFYLFECNTVSMRNINNEVHVKTFVLVIDIE